MITRYATWCRRQASAASCFHVVLPCLVLVVLAAWGITEFVTRFALVIEHTALAVAGVLAALAVTWAVLAYGETRQLRWLRTRCQDCRRARAVAEVTYANGLRSDTVRSCGDCWTRAEREAGAAGWDVDTSGPGLPVITAGAPMEARVLPWEADPVPGYLAPPELAIVAEGIPGLTPPDNTAPPELAPATRAALAAAVRDWVPGPPPAPDNTAASAPLPPELAAYEPGIIPPSAWTRGHP